MGAAGQRSTGHGYTSISCGADELWRAIDEATSISATDLEGNIVFVNDRFLAATKYTRAEILGRNHRILNSGLHPAEFFQDLWETILAGRTWRGTVRDKAKDGTLFWMDTTIIPLKGSHGLPFLYLAIRHDVTRQMCAEEVLESQAARHDNMERLTALGEMEASIGHEIRNPLAALHLQLQLLKRKAEKGNTAPESVLSVTNRMESMLARIGRIIDGLQLFSRNAEGDPFERVPLGELVSDTLEFCRHSLQKKGIAFGVSLPAEPVLIYCRRAQIAQVLLNLVNNSRDAVEALELKWIRIEASTEADRIILRVIDSGPGIPPALAERIMQPFFSTKAPGKGTGLGLSIACKIMESHEGKLSLDQEHANTCFVIELPKPPAD